MKKIISFLLACMLFAIATGQNYNLHQQILKDVLLPNVRTAINVPDILGYKTLKCDFHIHTYFSDGEVSPTLRVTEAWCEGLDAIAITDHNKYKKEFLATDYNYSFDMAKKKGDELGLILIKGIEYTAGKPVGHHNFIFIDEANQYESKVIKPDSAFGLAASKGAFIIWNHPGWPDGNCQLYDFQKKYINQKIIGAIEIFNHDEFYPLAIDFCMDNNLAPIGSSDIHIPINLYYDLTRTKRPMTFVFATESTEKGIKEALISGRTVAYFNNLLAGKEEYIKAIFNNSLEVIKIEEQQTYSIFDISNKSDISYYLDFKGKATVLPAGKTIRMKIKTSDFSKVYTMENSFCRSQTHVEVSLPLQ